MNNKPAIPKVVACITRLNTLLLIKIEEKYLLPSETLLSGKSPDKTLISYLNFLLQIKIRVRGLLDVDPTFEVSPSGTTSYLNIYYHCSITSGLPRLERNRQVYWLTMKSLPTINFDNSIYHAVNLLKKGLK
jgi:hypothetical protein